MAHGQITFIELPADDSERAQRFYSGPADAIGGVVNDSEGNELGLYEAAD